MGAVVIAAFHGLATASIWRAHPLVSILIAGYSIFHLIALAVVLVSNQGSIGIGLIATLAAYVTIGVILVKPAVSAAKGIGAEVGSEPPRRHDLPQP
jgi:hypothetical protein